MTKMIKAAMLAAVAMTPQLATAQAAPTAPVASAPAYSAVADFSAAIRRSRAFQTAAGQVQTQYKAQIDTYNARSAPLQAELQRLGQEIQTLQQTPSTPKATLDAKVAAFTSRRDAIQRELAPLSAPFERPLAYVEEQISARMDEAVRAAMTAKRVNILLNPQAVTFLLPTADITGDVAEQLDRLVPTVSSTPPANWQPGQAQAGAPAAAAPPASSARKPSGR